MGINGTLLAHILDPPLTMLFMEYVLFCIYLNCFLWEGGEETSDPQTPWFRIIPVFNPFPSKLICVNNEKVITFINRHRSLPI